MDIDIVLHPTVIIVNRFSHINNFSLIDIYHYNLITAALNIFSSANTATVIIMNIISLTDLVDYNFAFIFIS